MLKIPHKKKKYKKYLSSILLLRGIDFNHISVILGVTKQASNFEKVKKFRLTKSALMNVFLNIDNKMHLVKVENSLNIFKSCEKFDLLLKSKRTFLFCITYYKNLIFKNSFLLKTNSLFWLFIHLKLNSILNKTFFV